MLSVGEFLYEIYMNLPYMSIEQYKNLPSFATPPLDEEDYQNFRNATINANSQKDSDWRHTWDDATEDEPLWTNGIIKQTYSPDGSTNYALFNVGKTKVFGDVGYAKLDNSGNVTYPVRITDTPDNYAPGFSQVFGNVRTFDASKKFDTIDRIKFGINDTVNYAYHHPSLIKAGGLGILGIGAVGGIGYGIGKLKKK